MSSMPARLGDEHRRALLKVASDSIVHGLEHNCPLPVEPADHAAPLREVRATFVTLNLANKLRGCIGTLEARRTLIADVAHNAFAAAFRDPRFKPVTKDDADQIDVHISLLSPPEPIQFNSEMDLIRKLRPRVDGLIFEEGPCRSTFLPAVWESLPEPHQFFEALKRKAGLLENYWSGTIRVWRYTTESIPQAY